VNKATAVGARRRPAVPILMAAMLVASLCALPAAPLLARDAPEVGDDPAVEKHMMALSAELRCLQCQNQTLADSNAPLAVDLRQEIREMLASGKTDAQVKQYLAARYGDFVFYKPPVKSDTLLLWFGPGLLLLGGFVGLYFALKRRNAHLAAAGATAELSDAEARRAQNLLEEEPGESSLS